MKCPHPCSVCTVLILFTFFPALSSRTNRHSMVVRGFRAPWTNLQQNTAHISFVIRNHSANAFTCSQNMPKRYHDNLRRAHQSIQFGDTTVYTRWYFSHSTSGGLSTGWACLFGRLKSSWVFLIYGSRLPTCYCLLIRRIPQVCER